MLNLRIYQQKITDLFESPNYMIETEHIWAYFKKRILKVAQQRCG